MSPEELAQATHQLTLQRVQVPNGRVKEAHELAENEYSPCEYINAQKAQGTLTRSAISVGTGCRKCNPSLTACANACAIPTEHVAHEKGYHNVKHTTPLERASFANINKTLERVKSASELADNETSPCEAVNAQKRLQRAQEANSTVENIMQWRQANDAFQRVASQCRKCNPYIKSCYCGCDISSKAIATQKGYSE
jgi:hypothetical protein